MNTMHKADGLPPEDEATVDDLNFPDMGELSITIIGPGAVVTGDIVSELGISVYGTVVGDLICQDGLLHVGDSGVVTGNVDGYNVEVDGLVEGDVLAHHTLTIKGKIRGTMGYMVELFVAPHLDVDGHIRKVKADAAGAFARHPAFSFVTPPVPHQSAHAAQTPEIDQPYAPAGYVHVTRTSAFGSHAQATLASNSQQDPQTEEVQQRGPGSGQFAASQFTQPLHRVV